jgi:hypothetical protein
MPRVVIKPKALELGIHREEYERLEAALEREGFRVRIEEPEECRSGGVPGAEVPYDVLVFLAEEVGEHVVEVLVGVILAELLGKIRRRRTAAILGPNGRVIRKVTLRDANDDGL